MPDHKRRLTILRPRLAPAPSPQGWTRTESASSRGYGYRWQQTRERVMVRDCGLCQPCQRHHIATLGSDCDHVVPKDQGGTDDERNLQCICGGCHTAKTQAERMGARWDEHAHFSRGGASKS